MYNLGPNNCMSVNISYKNNIMNSKNICSEMLIAALFVRAKVGNNLNACQWKNSEIMTIFTIHLFKKMI